LCQFWGAKGLKVPIFPHFFWPKINENLICEIKLSSGRIIPKFSIVLK